MALPVGGEDDVDASSLQAVDEISKSSHPGKMI
jgi:hypothetical protein